MTREYWEQNYRREYVQYLRERFVNTCKGIICCIIGTLLSYKFICIITTVIELITGNYALF